MTSEKPSLAELKNGKVIFKQKPVSFEKHSETMKGVPWPASFFMLTDGELKVLLDFERF